MSLLNDLPFIPIGIASPESIKEWKMGKLERPKGVSCMKTFKPEKEGLFSERILGKEKKDVE